MLDEVFAPDEMAEGIKITIGSGFPGQSTQNTSGRGSPGTVAHNLLEQTARTCQSFDFTAGTTDQAKSTMSQAK